MPEDIMPVAEPTQELKQKSILAKQWHVILLNDEEHTFQYVVDLLMKIFHYDLDKAFAIVIKIDQDGQAVVDTTSKERAELKQEQVHGMGPDFLIPASKGPITCVIEPAP